VRAGEAEGRVMYLQGLGSTWKLESDGTWVDCDTGFSFLDWNCWNPFNPQLAGPQASNPTVPSNPLTDIALGVDQTGSGTPISGTDYLSAVAGNGLSWVAIAGIAVIGVLGLTVILPALTGGGRRR